MTRERGLQALRAQASNLWRTPKGTARIGGVLILAAIVVAGIGRREVFSLAAEDPARSVHRFAAGGPEVAVTTQMPWSRVPAVLPGSADAWTAAAAHAITLHAALTRPRTLLLFVHPSRTRPRELPPTAGPSDAAGRLRIITNDVSLGVFDTPGLARTGGHEHRHPADLTVPIPVSALGAGTSLRITLVNEGPNSLGLRHLRLIEAAPSFSLGHLARGGHFPPVSASLLAVGLALLLRGRLEDARGRRAHRPWRHALGPGLGLLILALAVMAPAPVRAVPHWAWLLFIVSVLPLGRRPAPPSTAPRTWAPRLARAAANGLLALVGLAGALVVGELALRQVFGDEPWARLVLHTPGPGPGRAPELNSLGFYEREFSIEKPTGVYRIAILGDSLSVSAPRSERFGDVIADRLNASPSRSLTYEAVSFGRAGIDTNVEIEILQQVVWRTKPDFILLEFYVNDLENGDYTERPHPSPLIPGESAPARWLQRLTDRLLLRRLVEEEYYVLQERLGLVETYPAYMYGRFGDPAGAHWQTAAYELRDFMRECRAHGTPLAIALFPHLSAGLTAGTYEFAELYDQVGELCRQQGVPCIDLRPTYAPYRDYTRLWINRFDPHPNALAHRLAGERLMEVLGSYWLDAGRDRSTGGGPPLNLPAVKASTPENGRGTATGGVGVGDPGLVSAAGAAVSRGAAPDSAAFRSRRS